MDLDLINNTRNLFLLLTAIGAAIGVYLNGVNNLYYNLIKLNFKNIPVKMSSFKVIVTWISIILFVFDFIYLVYSIWRIFNTKGQKDTNINVLDMFSLSGVIATIIIIIIIIVFIGSIFIFSKIKILFIKKLKTNQNINMNKYFIYINWTSIISSGIMSFFLLVLIVGAFVSSSIKYKEIISVIILFLIVFTEFILAIALRELINAINDNYEYILIDSKENVCKCYIDYDEYYLLFNNGIETYIKKSDIKRIVKKKSII